MSGSELPDELLFLVMLHAIGATASERSLTLQQISEWTRVDTPTLQFRLQKLVELGYLHSIQAEGGDKYHVTLDGIRECERLSRERMNARCQLSELKEQLGRGDITQEEYEQKEKELLKKAWDPT